MANPLRFPHGVATIGLLSAGQLDAVQGSAERPIATHRWTQDNYEFFIGSAGDAVLSAIEEHQKERALKGREAARLDKHANSIRWAASQKDPTSD